MRDPRTVAHDTFQCRHLQQAWSGVCLQMLGNGIAQAGWALGKREEATRARACWSWKQADANYGASVWSEGKTLTPENGIEQEQHIHACMHTERHTLITASLLSAAAPGSSPSRKLYSRESGRVDSVSRHISANSHQAQAEEWVTGAAQTFHRWK